jgi:predicted nucleic acid-binding protein
LILDASAALAWLIERKDPVEANLALEILSYLRNRDAVVPALWFPEVANGILVAERRVGVDAAKSASFLAIVDQVKITEDSTRSFALQGTVLDLARTYGRRHLSGIGLADKVAAGYLRPPVGRGCAQGGWAGVWGYRKLIGTEESYHLPEGSELR